MAEDQLTKVSRVTLEFPHADVAAALRDELLSNVELQASIYGTELPASQSAMVKQQVSIDSLVTVEILCAVEPIVGCELPEAIVRHGGYNSVDDALSDLMPRIEKIWKKRKRK